MYSSAGVVTIVIVNGNGNANYLMHTSSSLSVVSFWVIITAMWAAVNRIKVIIARMMNENVQQYYCHKTEKL